MGKKSKRKKTTWKPLPLNGNDDEQVIPSAKSRNAHKLQSSAPADTEYSSGSERSSRPLRTSRPPKKYPPTQNGVKKGFYCGTRNNSQTSSCVDQSPPFLQHQVDGFPSGDSQFGDEERTGQAEEFAYYVGGPFFTTPSNLIYSAAPSYFYNPSSHYVAPHHPHCQYYFCPVPPSTPSHSVGHSASSSTSTSEDSGSVADDFQREGVVEEPQATAQPAASEGFSAPPLSSASSSHSSTSSSSAQQHLTAPTYPFVLAHPTPCLFPDIVTLGPYDYGNPGSYWWGSTGRRERRRRRRPFIGGEGITYDRWPSRKDVAAPNAAATMNGELGKSIDEETTKISESVERQSTETEIEAVGQAGTEVSDSALDSSGTGVLPASIHIIDSQNDPDGSIQSPERDSVELPQSIPPPPPPPPSDRVDLVVTEDSKMADKRLNSEGIPAPLLADASHFTEISLQDHDGRIVERKGNGEEEVWQPEKNDFDEEELKTSAALPVSEDGAVVQPAVVVHSCSRMSPTEKEPHMTSGPSVDQLRTGSPSSVPSATGSPSSHTFAELQYYQSEDPMKYAKYYQLCSPEEEEEEGGQGEEEDEEKGVQKEDSGPSECGSEDVELIGHRYESSAEKPYENSNTLSLAAELLSTSVLPINGAGSGFRASQEEEDTDRGKAEGRGEATRKDQTSMRISQSAECYTNTHILESYYGQMGRRAAHPPKVRAADSGIHTDESADEGDNATPIHDQSAPEDDEILFSRTVAGGTNAFSQPQPFGHRPRRREPPPLIYLRTKGPWQGCCCTIM